VQNIKWLRAGGRRICRALAACDDTLVNRMEYSTNAINEIESDELRSRTPNRLQLGSRQIDGIRIVFIAWLGTNTWRLTPVILVIVMCVVMPVRVMVGC
jgi:hypothetical protein